MHDSAYRSLMGIAITLTIAWIGWTIYDSVIVEETPGNSSYLAGNNYFEDGFYQDALREYEAALDANPDHIYAKRGQARSLMQLGHNLEALEVFNEAIRREPEFGATYAYRGILHDRMGYYEAAARDYEQAVRLDPELAEGPKWLTRFLRNQAERPSTIADRARYIRQQLAKPESERLLRMPETDAEQRPYKL